MKKIIATLIIGLIITGCGKAADPGLEPPVEMVSADNIQTEDPEYVIPDVPDEAYEPETFVLDHMDESGSEPDYLIDGEWLPDMGTWNPSPYPEYSTPLDYALWNESITPDVTVEQIYADEVEPIIREFLSVIFNTEGEIPDYTEQLLSYCIEDRSSVHVLNAVYPFYSQMGFTFETYKNSLDYYYSDGTFKINGLAVIRSDSDILANNRRLHYIIPFVIGMEKNDDGWKIFEISGFSELYYADTVATYTNESHSAILILGHKLIDFGFDKYIDQMALEELPAWDNEDIQGEE